MPKPASMSLTVRLMNVFAVPGDVFDEVKTSPPATSNWLVPVVLLIVLSWLASGLVMSQDSFKHQVTELAEKAIQKQLDKMNLPKDQVEKVRPTMEKWAVISTTAAPLVGIVFVAFATPFWWGLILWLVGAKGFKGDFPYRKAAEVGGLANVIGAMEVIVKTLLIFAFGSVFASPSLALLVKDFDPQNPLHTLLASVNVFQFWFLAVVAIGLARLSNRSFAKAAVWIFGIWATYTGLIIGFQAAMQAAFGHMKGGGT